MRIDLRALFVSLFVLGSLAGGCVPAEPYLQWEARPPAPPQGRVAFKFMVDKRDGKHGGASDPDDIGNLRSGFGIPYAIRINQPPNKGLQAALGDLVTQSLGAVGVQVTAMQDPAATAHLSLEILDFWCDGYMGYKATVSFMLVILDPATGAPRTSIPMQHQASAGSGWGNDPCRNAYHQALNAIAADLVAAFAQPPLRAALFGAPPPPQ